MHVLADGTQMQWGKYEVFSVLSVVVLGLGACMPGIRLKDRLWAAIGAVILVVLAYQSGHATSGTFIFPAQVFFIPPVAGIWLVYKGMTTISRKSQAGIVAGTEAATGQSCAAQAECSMAPTSIPAQITPLAPVLAATTRLAPAPAAVPRAAAQSTTHAPAAAPDSPRDAAALASQLVVPSATPGGAPSGVHAAVGCSNSGCVQHGTTTTSRFCTACGAHASSVPSA